MPMKFSGGAAARRRTVRRRFSTPVIIPLHGMLQNNKTQEVGVSARKLAAGLWRLRFSSEGSGFWSFDGSYWEFGSCFPCKKHPIEEESTKWDCRCSKTSDIDGFRNDTKVLTNQVEPVSTISLLRAELLQAHYHITVLESEVISSKKELNQLVRKLGHETSSQCTGEFDKARADIRQLKDELKRENRKQQKLEIHYAKAKFSAKQSMNDYKEEKKTRKILEGVCYELAKKLGKEKVQFGAFQQELLQMQQELEEERNKLQMAEVWREERVQMKLVDAKIALENKYAEMNKLISVLETFLKSRNANVDVSALRDSEQIIEAVKSVNVQDMKELTYVRSKSDDPYAITEEMQHFQAATDALRRDGDGSKDYHPTSPAMDEFDYSRSLICYSNGYIENQDSNISLDKGKEKLASNATVSPHRQSVEGRRCVEGGIKRRDTMNPHIARGMKGLIEWPSSFLKNNLKLRKQIIKPQLNNTDMNG